MKYKLVTVLALMALSINQAQATIIGNLEYNGTTITGDGQTYLAFDTLAGLTYAETLAITSAAGAYEDYRIANRYDVDNFLDSLFGGVSQEQCYGTNPVEGWSSCSYLDFWEDNAFGDIGSNFGDTFFFLTDEAARSDVGLVRLENNKFWGPRAHQIWSWADVGAADRATERGNANGLEYTWLAVLGSGVNEALGRPAIVSEPPSLPLVALGIMGLALRRFKKQS